VGDEEDQIEDEMSEDDNVTVHNNNGDTAAGTDTKSNFNNNLAEKKSLRKKNA